MIIYVYIYRERESINTFYVIEMLAAARGNQGSKIEAFGSVTNLNLTYYRHLSKWL